MFWEAGIKFLMVSIYAYVRHLSKHFRHEDPPDSRIKVGAEITPSLIEEISSGTFVEGSVRGSKP